MIVVVRETWLVAGLCAGGERVSEKQSRNFELERVTVTRIVSGPSAAVAAAAARPAPDSRVPEFLRSSLNASRTRRGRDHRPALLDGWVIRFGLPSAFIRFRRPRANISSAIRGLQTTASAYHPLHDMAHRCRQEAVVAGAAVYLVHHDAHHCKRRPRNCRSGPEY